VLAAGEGEGVSAPIKPDRRDRKRASVPPTGALERRRVFGERRRSARLWPRLAITAIVILLGTNGLAWFLLFIDDPPPTTQAPSASADESPTEEPPPLPIPPPAEIVPTPDLGVYGRNDYRGNTGLTGETDGGFRTLLGSYWSPVQPGGFFGADPIAYGRFLYVVSATHDAVYAIDQTNGMLKFSIQTNGRMQSAPAVGQFTYSTGPEGTSETATRLIAVSEDGTVYSRNALGSGNSGHWQMQLGVDVSAAPLIVEDKIIIATESGSVIAVAIDSEVVWRYPIPNTYSSAFTQTPAVSNGAIYVPDEAGRLHVISLEDGTAVCLPIAMGARPSSHPLIADDQVLVPTDGSIMVFPTERCNAAPRLILDQVDLPFSPAYADSTIFSVENSFLLAWDLETLADSVWDGPYNAGDRITTAPTVAEGVVYLGTQGGTVHAVDAATGESLWKFDVGEPIFGGPVVATNGIFVTTAQEIFSIAGE